MNSFDFLQKMDGISPEFIEESLSTDLKCIAPALQSLSPDGNSETVSAAAAQPAVPQKRSILRTAVSYVSLAACVMLAVGSAFLFRNLHQDQLLESSQATPLETTRPVVTATSLHTEPVLRTETTQTIAQTTQTETAASSVTAESLAVTELTAEVTQDSSAETVTETEATQIVTETEQNNSTAEKETEPVQTTSPETTPTTMTEPTVTAAQTETEPPESNVIVTTSAAPQDHPESIGDIDGDGYVTEADVAILYCIYMREKVEGTRFVSDERYRLADVNRDGIVTYADQIVMVRYVWLYWYGDYRSISMEDYLNNLDYFNQCYLDADVSSDFGDLYVQAAYVLSINEEANSATSSQTYEQRAEESEEALRIVRDEYYKLL